jgi:DNA-damage-inducible protein D
MTTNELTKISLFHGKHIRKILWNDEWYFSIVDVCNALLESSDAGAYWRKLKQRLVAERE